MYSSQQLCFPVARKGGGKMRALFILCTLPVLIDTDPVSAAASPTTASSASQPATHIERLAAVCIKTKGTVQSAPVGAESTDTKAWKPVRVGDKLTDGMQVRTGVRSSAIFQFGDDTVVMVGRSTLAAIGEFYKSANTKRTRIGLDYGSVRAGVAEGGLRSDFKIDSPVATLSKRGTWDFELWVERGTGRFKARLADRGLVEVLHKSTGRTRRILPKQAVTQAMRNWVETAKFDRAVVVADSFSQTPEEIMAYMRTNTGRTGLYPPQTASSSGTQAAAASERTAAQRNRSLNRGSSAVNLAQLSGLDYLPSVIHSDDGNFGTGTGFSANSAEWRAVKRTVRVLHRRWRRR